MRFYQTVLSHKRVVAEFKQGSGSYEVPAGLTCRADMQGGSWVEDQREGDESFSGGVRVEGAPTNTDDL